MKRCKLIDIAIIVAGQSPKSEYYTFNNLDTPFLQGNRTFGDKYPYIDTYTKKVTKLAPKNSILMSVRAPVGDLNIATEDCCIGRGLCSINAINGDNEFLYYLLKHNIKSIINQGNGTTYDAINKEQLESLEIQLPSENEDDLKKISNLLSVLDDKIQNNNKINFELEAMAKTIYDYWFLQFEFPNEEGKPYKSSGGKMVWNEELGREIPEGWEVKKLGDSCKCILGGTPSRERKEYWGGNINWINSGMINNFRISSYSERITKLGLENSSTYLMPKNTVVLAITGATLGQVSILNIEACANQSVVGILENSQIPTEYIYPFILSTIKNIINNKTGAAQPHINKNDVMSFKIIIPNKKIMKDYIDNVKCIYDLIMKNEEENQQLLSLRDFLLPLLMNGQIGFKENISAKEIEIDREDIVAYVNR